MIPQIVVRKLDAEHNGGGGGGGGGTTPHDENIVQWKQKNIKDGFVVVDESQLSRLIKREPIEKYYALEKEPFAKGLFACVRRCRSLDSGRSFAAKFSSRERYGEDCSAEVYHEIALLSLCGGAPRIVQIHDVFENDREIVLVMEYAPGGDLQTVIDDDMVPFESDVLSFVRQTVEGLEYLHRRRIAHLDIKPQNIVMMGDFPNCDVKLCDLEISRVILEEDKIRDFLGTPDYVAPEVIHYDPITLAADMWSLGVTTYVLLTGFTPFGGETDQETFCNISRAEVDFPEELFEDVSDEAVDFIRTLLVKNPSARPTASACLKHPWLSKKEAARDDHRREEKSLRKYLSKSREALFEKVVQQQQQQQQQQHKGSATRKGPVNSHILKARRLCESQISLVSKSRERLCSRSTEKLYGLRSLSKSQEVLNLYKNGSLLTSQENIDKVSEMIKSRESLLERMDAGRDRRLTRAVTTDLGSLHNRNKPPRTYSGSSTTSLASITIDVQEEKPEEAAAKEVEEEGGNSDEEEPRFTVAQLITAFNKHQEIVTKTSLEVTMTAQEKNSKIPPVIHYNRNSPFPTGPTALRLFIPDIDLVRVPKTKAKSSVGSPDASEPSSGDWGKASTEADAPKASSHEELATEAAGTAASRRCKSSSPSPAKKSGETRKSPRRDVRAASKHPETSSQYKIVGMRERGGSAARKSSGVSYDIEFEGPTVTRKFPVRNNPTKGTISSNLKAKEPKRK